MLGKQKIIYNKKESSALCKNNFLFQIKKKRHTSGKIRKRIQGSSGLKHFLFAALTARKKKSSREMFEHLKILKK